MSDMATPQLYSTAALSRCSRHAASYLAHASCKWRTALSTTDDSGRVPRSPKTLGRGWKISET